MRPSSREVTVVGHFASGHRDEITIASELVRRVRDADKLFEEVVASREAAIDAEHFKMLSEIARERAQSARGELVTFDPIEYTEKLVSASEWMVILRQYRPYSLPPRGRGKATKGE